MKTKLISSILKGHSGYGAGPGIVELFEYECPCKKGKIIEEHYNIPGYEEHVVHICCEECCEKYELNLRYGIRSWDLNKK